MTRRRAGGEAVHAGERSIDSFFYAAIRQQMGPTGESDFDLHACASTLFRLTKGLIEQHRSGSAADRADEEIAVCDLTAALAIIANCEDAAMRRAALSGIVAAQMLGFHHRGTPRVIRRAKEDADAEAGDLLKAARRIDAIRAIIDLHASCHLKEVPTHLGNARAVATAIAYDVARDVQGLQRVPKAWREPMPLPGQKFVLENKRLDDCIERIRKQLPKCSCWTTVSRP